MEVSREMSTGSRRLEGDLRSSSVRFDIFSAWPFVRLSSAVVHSCRRCRYFLPTAGFGLTNARRVRYRNPAANHVVRCFDLSTHRRRE